MLRTIVLGSCSSVQGTFLKAVGGGRIAVQVDGNVFIGKAVPERVEMPPSQSSSENAIVAL